ncbi:LacI family DNA-binding transcriptional regulator, partial [Streptococcus suis]
MVTIKDVAQRAGVNPSTVSRVLRDNRSISQKTKEKVRKAMDELGYVPNVAAQMLANGST